MLSDFEIENFRTFRHLRLTGLGEVNLFVGENNVGKTMLLEALRLYRSGGTKELLSELLHRCNEFNRGASSGALRFLSLFNGRKGDARGSAAIVLRGGEGDLNLAIGWSGAKRMLMVNGHDFLAGSLEHAESGRLRHTAEEALPPLVPVRGISETTLGLWWDEFALTQAEQRILSCLQVASPIERMNLVDKPDGRMFVVKMAGEDDPIPLRALGAGVSRLFEFALALERARSSGMLLIDEIENGVYYGAHAQLWRFLIQAARAQGVQLFATTHSWDCIRGLQRALGEEPQTSALLVRLQRQGDDIYPVHYSREELALAVAEDIEVR